MKMFFYSVIAAALLSCSASHANPAQIGLRQDEGTSEAVAEIKDLPGNVFGEIYRIPEAGEMGNALYLRGNNLYCASGSRVLVFDVSSPLAPRLRSECSIDGGARQIVADDRAIYVTTRGNGLHIVDASDLDAIKYLKFYDTIELATGVDVAGDVLFVTLRGYGVEFIDVRDIRNPRHIRLQQTIESQSCWYQDGYLYSGEWGKGKVTTIAASDMGHVSALGEVDLRGHGDGLFGQRSGRKGHRDHLEGPRMAAAHRVHLLKEPRKLFLPVVGVGAQPVAHEKIPDGAHSLTPPAVMPMTMYFWKITVIATGISEPSMPATLIMP